MSVRASRAGPRDGVRAWGPSRTQPTGGRGGCARGDKARQDCVMDMSGREAGWGLEGTGSLGGQKESRVVRRGQGWGRLGTQAQEGRPSCGALGGRTFPLSPCLRSGLLPRQAPCKAPPPSEAAPLPGSRSSPSSEVLTGPAHAAWSQGEPWPRTHHPQRPGTCDFGQGTTAPTWRLFQVAQL